MKSRVLFAVAAVLLCLGGSAQAHLFTYMFDEKGNGSIAVDGGPMVPITGVLQQDPGPGGRVTLAYDLQFMGQVPGDVIMTESGGGNSDLLRFNGDGFVYFYSDVGDGVEAGDRADVGFPSAMYGNTATFAQGADGTLTYTPTPPQPGFMAQPGSSSFDVTYIFKSDVDVTIMPGPPGVPEPGTLSLLGIGALSLAAYAWRRRHALVP